MVAPFVCTALWDKILTCDNLMEKGITLVDWCCMRRCNSKNVDHFLVHCDVAQKLWSLLSSMFGDAHDQLFFSWKNWTGKHGNYLAWNMAPLYLIWTLWRERNDCFNGVEISMISDQAEIFFCDLSIWVVSVHGRKW